MQFKSVLRDLRAASAEARDVPAERSAAESTAAPGAPPQVAPPPPEPPRSPTPPGRQALIDASQNLLKHIPGEASGFYLLAADSLTEPSTGTLAFIFVLSLALLVTVRWLAAASRGVMITTVLAFLLWMLILDKGFLHVAFPAVLPPPLGLIVAVFYSTVVTLLASAGKIK